MDESKQNGSPARSKDDAQTSDNQHESGLLETAAHAIGATLGSIAAKTGLIKPVKAAQKRTAKKAAVKRPIAKKSLATKKSTAKKPARKSARKR